MAALLGKKVGMTQVFEEDGTVVPVTVIRAEPNVVVRQRTPDVDGYSALQVGFAERKPKHTTRPLAGYFKKQGVEPRRHLREFRLDAPPEHEVGHEFTVEIFEPGVLVDVVGVSKGKGFQGVMKRHGFGAGKDSHGSKTGRLPGSVGMSAYPGRVLKGKKLPGRMGGVRVTQRNLKVVGVDAEQHLIWLRGAVPGATGGMLMVRSAVAANARVTRRARGEKGEAQAAPRKKSKKK